MPSAERDALAARIPQLVAHLAWVPDPRDPRGVRHSLTSLLTTAVAAVLAGATSFTAIAEWVADAPAEVLATLGIRYDQLARSHQVPDEATVREVLERLDAAAFTAAAAAWLGTVIAQAEIDGKTSELAAWIRQHWQIEALHHIRDVTYREDHSQIRTGNGPAAMAAFRNLAIALLKLCGWTNIAKANRHLHHNPHRCLDTLGLTTRHHDP
jgi:hypothetical protein